MAIIQKLRNKSGLMLVVIGGSLLLFVLMDALSNKRGGGLGSDDPNELGEVNGTTIETKEYNAFVQNLEMRQRSQSQGMPIDDYTQQQINEQAWNTAVGLALVDDECEAMGISSSDEEVAEIFLNPQYSYSRAVAEMLNINPESTEQLREAIKNSSDAKVLNEVSKFEKQIRQQLNYYKYQSLLRAGFVTTKSEAKYQYTTNNEIVEFEVGSIAYSTTLVNDSTIKVSEEELQAAYEKDKNNYKQKEGRDIKYLLFPQEASAKDEAALMATMQEVKTRFAGITKNEGIFVSGESDGNAPYDASFHKKGDGLPMALDSNFASLAEGQIFGPYAEFGVNGKKTIRVSKVLKVRQLADSVRVKHILISYKGAPDVLGSENLTITTQDALFAKADSLFKKVEKNKELFEELAMKNSDDVTSKASGGDIGWVNSTNKYSYMFDSCMLNTGAIMKIPGRDGIHLVKVVQQGVLTKKVNVGTISRELKVSEETKLAIRAVATKAADLLANKKENIDSMAAKNNYRLMSQPALGRHDIFVQGLQGAREVVKWAYNANVGDISDVKDIYENYVVVMLQKQYEEGYKTLDDEQVKRELEMKVRNQKKGEILQKKINDVIAKGAKSIQDIKNSIPELYTEKSNPGPLTGGVIYSDEADLIGMVGALPANTLSKAFVGKRAVYVVFVIKKSGLLPITDFSQEINAMNREIKGNQNQPGIVEKFVGDALKTNADIEDYRFEKLD